jgi:hypothetical protein
MLMIASYRNRYMLAHLHVFCILLCKFIFFFGLSYHFFLVPWQQGHGSQSVAMVEVTTMTVDSSLLILGFFQGELICKVFSLQKCLFTLQYFNLVQ